MVVHFHSTAREFVPGDRLLPPSQSGVAPNYDLGRPTTRVYLSTSLDEAEEWAAHIAMTTRAPTVHIYEVAPEGRVQSKWLADMEMFEHHAATAVVVRQVA